MIVVESYTIAGCFAVKTSPVGTCTNIGNVKHLGTSNDDSDFYNLAF